MTYTDIVNSWRDFYVSAAAAAGTLAGLLFVALSLHIRVVVGQPDVKSIARITLIDFFTVLLIGLLVLAPDINGTPNSTATWLAAVGLVSLALSLRPALDSRRQRRGRTIGVVVLIFRFGVSMLANAGAIAVAVLLTQGLVKQAFVWLLVVVGTLLVVAVRNTWDLLITVADRANRSQEN